VKKVLIFSLNYYPFVGGAEVAIQEITSRIPADQIEFHLIAYRFDANLPREEQVGNVFVHRVGWGRRGMTFSESFQPVVYLAKVAYVPLATLKALSLRRQITFGAAWAMMTYMVFPLVFMRMLGTGLPYLLTLQEGDPFERVFDRARIRFFSPLLLYGIRGASAVQAISSFLGEWARRCHFVGRLEIIPNGVDIQRFAGEPVPHAGTVLITSSRLVHKNAVDTIIRALALLPPEISLVVAGNGPDEASLVQLAQEQGVAKRVVWKGYVDHAHLPGLLHTADIFVRPSRSEGMGNSFIEAMAAELPVIGTQEGGISDFLFDAKRNPDKEPTGWAIDKDAPGQIAGAVQDILAHPNEVARTVANAKKLVSEQYEWNLIARRMKALMLSL